MKTINTTGWVYYYSDDYFDFLEWQTETYKEEAPLTVPETGKWLIFCRSYEYAEELCTFAIKNCGLKAAKHSADFSERDGVCCFYMQSNDFRTNMKFISLFKENGYLPKTKKGAYVNLAYKYDFETRLGLYGSFFKGSIHLKDYIDLYSGEWTDYVRTLEKKEEKKKIIDEMCANYFGDNAFGYAGSHLSKGDRINTDYVKEEIKKQGKTIKEIAEILEVSDSTVRAWINGKSTPLVDNAMALCLALDLDVSSVIINRE